MASAQTRSAVRIGSIAVDEDCLRLTSYFRERQRTEGRSPGSALTDLYAGTQVAASIVLRGTEGSSAAVAVSSRPDIEALLSRAVELTGEGLVTIEQTRLLTGDSFQPIDWVAGEARVQAPMVAGTMGEAAGTGAAGVAA